MVCFIPLKCDAKKSGTAGTESGNNEGESDKNAEPPAGVGLSIGMLSPIDGQPIIVVQAIAVGTPAAKAKIAVRDVISAIDGTNLQGLSMDEVVAKIRGKAGSRVKLTLFHDGRVRTVTLSRKKLPPSTNPNAVKYLPPKIAQAADESTQIRPAAYIPAFGASGRPKSPLVLLLGICDAQVD